MYRTVLNLESDWLEYQYKPFDKWITFFNIPTDMMEKLGGDITEFELTILPQMIVNLKVRTFYTVEIHRLPD